MDGAGGKFSTPKTIATFGSETINGSLLLTVDEIPASSPFGFRASSTNAVGQGSFGPFVFVNTLHAPAPRPDAPDVVGTTAHEITVHFTTPETPKRPNRHASVPTSDKIPFEKVGNLSSYLLVSGTDFIFGTHQSIAGDGNPLSRDMKFEMVANVADDRSFQTVCNRTGPVCTFDNLRPRTKFIMKVRAIAPWGPSPWSDAVTTVTQSSFPDSPSEPEVRVVKGESGFQAEISWTPPESNGNPITGFVVLAGMIPQDNRTRVENLVCSRLPSNKYTMALTHDMLPFFPSRVGSVVPSVAALAAAQLDGAPVPNMSFVPNVHSPEAISVSKILPLPANMPTIVVKKNTDVFTLGADVFTQYTPVVANTTRLSFTWPLEALPVDALYAVRVQAVNVKGAGPPSAIKRFHWSSSSG